ncbi:MAG: MFS transporter [Dongiaceae bacterium]
MSDIANRLEPVRDDDGAKSPPRSIVAAVIGNALEFYDFTAYVAFSPMLGRVFFPASDPNISLLLSVATFGIGFFARPLGAVVFGTYSDRYGRKSAMTLTILLMALGSGMIGILPSYAQIGIAAPLLLVVARLIQGLSVGGEFAPATAYLMEIAPKKRQFFFVSWQLASQNMGNIISGIVGISLAMMLTSNATAAWGWRVPFLIGLVIAPIGFYIRRRLHETLESREMRTSMSAVLSDVAGHYGYPILLGVFIVSGITVSQYFSLYTTAYAITRLNYSQDMAMTLNFTLATTGMTFCVIGGLLADRYNVKALTVLPRLFMTLLLIPALSFALSFGSPVVFLAVMVGLMALHAVSAVPATIVMLRVFPAGVRSTGFSVTSALGLTVFGGTAQVVFTWIIGTTGDKLSWLWYVVAMNVASVVATMLIFEYLRRREGGPV